MNPAYRVVYQICTGCNGEGCPQCSGRGKIRMSIPVQPMDVLRQSYFPKGYTEALKESDKRMLNQLKNLNIERIDIDEAIALTAFGRLMEAEYSHFQAEPPDWLSDNLKELRREVRKRLEDTLESRLVDINSRLDSLSTVEEKREKLRAEAERLKSKLNKTGAQA